MKWWENISFTLGGERSVAFRKVAGGVSVVTVVPESADTEQNMAAANRTTLGCDHEGGSVSAHEKPRNRGVFPAFQSRGPKELSRS